MPECEERERPAISHKTGAQGPEKDGSDEYKIRIDNKLGADERTEGFMLWKQECAG